jgi:hypothetical protein
LLIYLLMYYLLPKSVFYQKIYHLFLNWNT